MNLLGTKTFYCATFFFFGLTFEKTVKLQFCVGTSFLWVTPPHGMPASKRSIGLKIILVSVSGLFCFLSYEDSVYTSIIFIARAILILN